MAQRSRPSRSITLDPDLMAKVEAEANDAKVSFSQVVEAHLREHYQGGVTFRLQQLESAVNELKAGVLPVAAKVADLIQQAEQGGPLANPNQPPDEPPLRIVPYEEIYADDNKSKTSEPPVETPRTVDLPKLPRRWRLSLW